MVRTPTSSVPASVTKLIEELAELPGIGRKTAARLTYFLLRGKSDLLHWTRYVAAHEHSTVDYLCQLLGVAVREYLETRRPYVTSDEIRRLAAEDALAELALGEQPLNLLAFDLDSEAGAEEDEELR